jgi:hypothetical protein
MPPRAVTLFTYEYLTGCNETSGTHRKRVELELERRFGLISQIEPVSENELIRQTNQEFSAPRAYAGRVNDVQGHQRRFQS